MSDDDTIGGLIASGMMLLVAYGIYRVLKSFGDFKEGEEIRAEDPRLSSVSSNRRAEPALKTGSQLVECPVCGDMVTSSNMRWDDTRGSEACGGCWCSDD